MILGITFLVIAIIALYFGAEFCLEAAEKIGEKLGMSPLLIGMIIIGFGTSLPEFFVGHIAAVQGKPGIAMGSLIGSNIANMMLILGVSGFICNLGLSEKSVKHQLLIHLVLGFSLVFILNQPVLGVIASCILLGICAVYLYMIFLDMKSSKSVNDEEEGSDDFNAVKLYSKLFGGFVLLYIGGELLVKGGTDICLAAGISEYVISSIFIAFGTSFPELVTVLMASLKKKDTNLIVGNIIGSNLFNCALILGSLGFYKFPISQNFTYELIVLLSGSVILVFLSFAKLEFRKFFATVFFSGYVIMVLKWLAVI